MDSRLRLAAQIMTAVLGGALLALPGVVAADTGAAADAGYVPQPGQKGKDVIWLPTPQALVYRMLEMAKTGPRDFVVDLGSGDGRTVIAAVKKFGARALGIEYNPDMVALSRRNAAKAGVTDRARFVQGDVFKEDFSDATVLTLYLLPRLNLKLRPTILQMKPGTRVVSHAFTMGDWQPDQTASAAGSTAYLWIVPARVEGQWLWGDVRPYTLELRQHYQIVEGLVSAAGKTAQFRNARLDGDRISFTVIEFLGLGTVRREYSGRVHGDTIEGAVKLPDGAGEEPWVAKRVKGVTR